MQKTKKKKKRRKRQSKSEFEEGKKKEKNFHIFIPLLNRESRRFLINGKGT